MNDSGKRKRRRSGREENVNGRIWRKAQRKEYSWVGEEKLMEWVTRETVFTGQTLASETAPHRTTSLACISFFAFICSVWFCYRYDGYWMDGIGGTGVDSFTLFDFVCLVRLTASSIFRSTSIF